MATMLRASLSFQDFSCPTGGGGSASGEGEQDETVRSEASDAEEKGDKDFDPKDVGGQAKKRSKDETQLSMMTEGVPLTVPFADDTPNQRRTARPVGDIRFQDIAKWRRNDDEVEVHVTKLRWDSDRRYGQIRKLRTNLVGTYFSRLCSKLPLRNPVQALLYDRGGLCTCHLFQS